MSEVVVNMKRVERIARAGVRAVLEKGVRKDAPSTELFVAFLAGAIMLAKEARPDRSLDDVCDLVIDIAGNFILDVRCGKIGVSLKEPA